jgi:hypothetical protein
MHMLTQTRLESVLIDDISTINQAYELSYRGELEKRHCDLMRNCKGCDQTRLLAKSYRQW